MDDTWDRAEFKDKLQALLSIQLPVGRKKIEALKDLAIKHPEHQNYLVQCICQFIETAPPDFRLSGLYLIDAIVKRCKDKNQERIANEYRKRFSIVFKEGALTGLFHSCLEEDKTKIDKVLNLWSEHIFPKHFVEYLKITVIQDTERRRLPVVLPTNFATDIALQQQGWQPGNTPPLTTTPADATTAASFHTSVSTPIDNNNIAATESVPSRLPQGVHPQLPVNTLDISNAVMHFLSVLNHGSFPMGIAPSNAPPMYGFPPTQPIYPWLSHTTSSTQSPTASKEAHIKIEDIPTCAEKTAFEETTSEQAAPDPSSSSSTAVKKEVTDTPFDRPPIKRFLTSSSTIEPTNTPSTISQANTRSLPALPPTQVPHAPPLPPKTPPLPPKSSPIQANLPTTTPVLPIQSTPKPVQPPKTPPLPPATLQLPVISTGAVAAQAVAKAVKAVPQKAAVEPVKAVSVQISVKPVKAVPPPKTPPSQTVSIPPPKTPPLPPQLSQKRLREPSPVSLPKKMVVPSTSQEQMDIDVTNNENKHNHANLAKNVNNSVRPGKDRDISKEDGFGEAENGSRSASQKSVGTTPSTKPSRWDIKAKNSKPISNRETEKLSTEASGSTTKLLTEAKGDANGSAKAYTNRKEKDIGNSTIVSTRVTTKREERDAGSSAKTSTGAITAQDEVANISTKKRVRATTEKEDTGRSKPGITKDNVEKRVENPLKGDPKMDKKVTEKPSMNGVKDDFKNKRRAPDNPRESSSKRAKTTTERSSRSESTSTSKKADAPAKSRVEKPEDKYKAVINKPSGGNVKPTSSTTKKTSSQPTKDRGSSSRRDPTDDLHRSRDYSRERDGRHRGYHRERDDRHKSRDYSWENDDYHSSRDSDQEIENRRFYSPQHDQPPRLTPYSPSQPAGPPANPVYSYSRFARPGPMSDPTLRLGTIRVLSRTLYVGPMPSSIKEDEVTDVFSQFGEVMSVIFSYRPDNQKNAFVKFINRESLQAAKNGSNGITFKSKSVKVNWAHGFGPKQLFDYEKGESILILNRLSDEDCASLKAAPVGGFQGSRIRDQVTVEEPGPFQQSTHREEHMDSPQFFEVRKFEETDRMLQSEYAQQYYGNDYGLPPMNNPSFTQTSVDVPQMTNGYYDQQGNYVYFIAAQEQKQAAYYNPTLYPTSGVAGQQYQQLPSPATPPTSQQFVQPQYHQYTYNNPNYTPPNQIHYFQQQHQSSNANYPSDYRRQ